MDDPHLERQVAESIRGIRNFLVLVKLLGTIEPELVDGLARSLSEAVALANCERFVNTWPGDFRFELHFSQRAPHGLSIQIIPVSVV